MEFHFMRKSVNTSSARCYCPLNPHFKTEVCFFAHILRILFVSIYVRKLLLKILLLCRVCKRGEIRRRRCCESAVVALLEFSDAA